MTLRNPYSNEDFFELQLTGVQTKERNDSNKYSKTLKYLIFNGR